MQQVIFDKSGRVLVRNVPVPAIDDNEVLVKNEFSVISAGTEKSMLQLMKKPLWKMALDRPDLAQQVLKFAKDSGVKKTVDLVKSRIDVWHLLGYSCAGVVVKAGNDVEDIKPGDRVACIGSNYANHADFVAVPKTLVAKIPKNVEMKDAAFTGIASIALQSVRQLNPQLGDKVAVIGLGLIGRMVAQMLRANGCTVIGVDLDKSKTEQAFIDEQISTNAVKNVLKNTEDGADGVIIAAASKHNLINDAFDMCRKRGTVVLLGMSDMNIDRQKMFDKEVTFKISTAFGAGTFEMMYENGKDYPIQYVRWTAQRNMESVLNLIKTGKLVFEDKQIFDVTDAKTAYKKLGHVLFRYKPEDDLQSIDTKKKPKGKINVAIIGAGQFIKGFILPAVKKQKELALYAIVTKSGTNAKKLTDEYGAKIASTSYEDILRDKNVDLVIIGTRHNSHAKIATRALESGKHVLCEKPMAIKENEFNILVKAINASKKIYTCGFNRRYSPAMQKIKSKLQDKPMMINYVFNNTELPKDHWANIREIGGGRIIGEACHIADVFNYLTGSAPVLVFAQKKDENNVMATIKYKDGSIASLSYICEGNSKVQRERCTVIQEGNVLEMDGFGKVKLNNGVIYNGKADEGHDEEIAQLSNALCGKENELASKEDCINATRTIFSIVN